MFPVSKMADRNPSPPPEINENINKVREDIIGNTAISKRWVYKALMNMMEETTQHRSKEENELVEISSELEEDCCRLWDLCMENDVALFMKECNGIKIIAGIIFASKSPRLTEISVGILANIACCAEICEIITNNVKIRNLIIVMLSSRDSPTLTEVVRLLRVCLSNKKCKLLWLESLKLSAGLTDNLQFILKNSTNLQLLLSLLEVVDICIDESNSMLNTCSTNGFVGCVIESGMQIVDDRALIAEKPTCISCCLHILQNLSTGKAAYNIFGPLMKKLVNLCAKICEVWISDDHGKIMSCLEIQEKNVFTVEHVAVASMLSLVNFVPNIKEILKVDKNIVSITKFISKLLEAAKNVTVEKPTKDVKSKNNEVIVIEDDDVIVINDDEYHENGRKFVLELLDSFRTIIK